MVGRVALVRDHRVSGESALCCGRQYCLALAGNQTIQKLRSQAVRYGSNPCGRHTYVSPRGHGRARFQLGEVWGCRTPSGTVKSTQGATKRVKIKTQSGRVPAHYSALSRSLNSTLHQLNGLEIVTLPICCPSWKSSL